MFIDALKLSALRICLLGVLLLLLTIGEVSAGGGPRDVAVVINSKSAISREIGLYYQAARGIPDKNICYISCPTDEVVSWQVCETQIREPLRTFLSRSNIAGQIHYIVLTKGIPLSADYVDGDFSDGNIDHCYSVESVLLDINQKLCGTSSTDPTRTPIATYSFYYGPTASEYWPGGAPKTAWSSNLFDSNIAGDQYDINKKLYLITRLDGYSVAQIKQMIDRSSCSYQNGAFMLDRNTSLTGPSKYANLRLGNLLNSAYDYLVKKGLHVDYDGGTTFLCNEQNAMGYFSWSVHDEEYSFEKYISNTFAPGSIGDTYWSYSGKTFNDPGTTQRNPLIADLFACGLCGAGGYVSEPYVTTATYPNYLFDRYTSGYNMAESFYAACPNGNWKTVIVGDPLMAPYATPPVVSIGLDSTTLSDTITATASATDASGISKVAFYFDDDLIAVDSVYPYSVQIDTTQYCIGSHTIEAIAYENSAVATQGAAKVSVLIDNPYSAVDKIVDARAYSQGQGVKIRSKVVTAGTSDIGDGFYIEDSDRSSAVKVISPDVVERGDIVTVTGNVKTELGEKVIDNGKVSDKTSDNTIPGPLFMQLAALGGAQIGSETSPVGLGFGARNVSLLVRVVGRVVSSADGEAYITDFSRHIPTHVICPGVTAIPANSWIAVTGICETECDGLGYQPKVRARDNNDVRILYSP